MLSSPTVPPSHAAPHRAMSVMPQLLYRSSHFAASLLDASHIAPPAPRTVVLACSACDAHSRAHPAHALGLDPSDTAVLRSMGGRVTAGVLDALAGVDRRAHSRGGRLGAGTEIVVLHHTGCAVNRLANPPELLEMYLGVPARELDRRGEMCPRLSVAFDVASLKAHRALLGGCLVSGCVYDVATGEVETVVQSDRVPEMQEYK